MFVQGRWCDGDTTDRFDAVAGYGPVIVADGALEAALAPVIAGAAAAGIKIFFADDSGQGDVDATYRAWLLDHGCDVVAVRGDFHVWGTAVATDVRRLVTDFMALFGTTQTTSAERSRLEATV